jgi:hypothetical protein
MDAREWGRWWRLVGRNGVLRVLSVDWDPIGFGELLPRDEYDCVAGPVGSMLRANASIGQIAAKLSEYRTGHFGLDASEPADQRAAREVVEWYGRAQSTAK